MNIEIDLESIIARASVGDHDAATTLHQVISLAGKIGNSTRYARWQLHDKVNRLVQSENGLHPLTVGQWNTRDYENAVEISLDGNLSASSAWLTAVKSRSTRPPEAF